MAIFTDTQKHGQINSLIKKYGSKENAYKALQIGLQRATQAGDELTVQKFNELISYFDIAFGIFSF